MNTNTNTDTIGTAVKHDDVKMIGNQLCLMTANRQWMTRPKDERFETLADLKTAVLARKDGSREQKVAVETLRAQPSDDGEGLMIQAGSRLCTPTNWAFSQVAQLVGAPGAYLRKLSPELAANCLNEGLANVDPEDTTKLLIRTGTDGNSTLRAATGPDYGRIWDSSVVRMAEAIVERSGGRMFNPKDWSGKPSGLYASDRDVFVFLIDGGSMVDGGGERDQLHRGVILSNSEVGKCTFIRQEFLFRQVCGNHIIWGMSQFSEVKIRHTSGAPDRFLNEAWDGVSAYLNSTTNQTREGILKAKSIGVPTKIDELIESRFAKNFTGAEIKGAVAAAVKEEGKCENLWELVQGLTAHAREESWLETRVDLERRAGGLLKAALK